MCVCVRFILGTFLLDFGIGMGCVSTEVEVVDSKKSSKSDIMWQV